MAYLSKSTILKAYKLLSSIDDEKQQGLTQKVSALKYLSALDLYYKNYQTNCDLKKTESKELFSTYVGEIVKINDDYCTKDFFTNISPNGRDYDCGSNFYSQTSVKDSRTNPAKTFLYPKRSGWQPVMDVKDQVLIYRPDYYNNCFSFYLFNSTLRLAFILWILRFENIQTEDLDGIKNALFKKFTSNYCNALFKDELYKANSVFIEFDNNICTLNKNDFSNQQELNQNNRQGTNESDLSKESIFPYLSALRTKPFVLLAGISGTGKSRIVRKLAQATNPKTYAKEEDRWKDNRPDNFELIQVKPNWHNSMDVVGFYSSVSKRYEFTPFVRFIVKAWQHLDTPYFLCLDEMNLAPVEEYFAEFLSAIESRSFDENGNYITDPIIKPFNEFEDEVKSKMLNELFKGKEFTEGMRLAEQFSNSGLTLPPNLMVMGTVNMDETTFTFSRKVLDRAMSMEMNEVDYDAFLSGETETMPTLTAFNSLLVDRPQKAAEVKDDIEAERIVAYLKSINALLDGTPFKLGYRAANEAMLYVSACQDFASDSFKFENALDKFTLMKILSRIEGDDSRLTLNDNDERFGNAGIATADLLANDECSPNLLHGLRAIVRKHIGLSSKTEKKINTMLKTMEHEHFVSYWN